MKRASRDRDKRGRSTINIQQEYSVVYQSQDDIPTVAALNKAGGMSGGNSE